MKFLCYGFISSLLLLKGYALDNNNSNGYISALYFTDWSYPESMPLDIPLSHVTNIFFAFGGLDTLHKNIIWANTTSDVQGNINPSIFALQNDCKDLKHHNVSENVNAEMYDTIPWLKQYLTNADNFISKYTENKESVVSQGLVGQLTQMKKLNPRLKVSLSVGGDGSEKHFQKMFKSKKNIKQFVANVAANLDAFGFDGVDIDWEFPRKNKDKENLLYMTEKFYERFSKMEADPRKRKMISVALPVDLDTLGYYDLKNMDKYVSYYNLMGYDISGTWSSLSGYQSQLYSDTNVTGGTPSVDRAVQYLSGYVDKSKIILGMPAYGVTFNTGELHSKFTGCAKLNNDLVNDIDADPSNCVVNYYDLPPDGYVEISNTEIGAAFAFKDSGDNKGIIVYDTPIISRMKARYVVNNGLAGGMWWDSHGDPLIKNTSRSLIYNFISELGGIHMLNNSISNTRNFDDGRTDILSVHMEDSDFSSNARKNSGLARQVWLIVCSSALFAFLI